MKNVPIFKRPKDPADAEIERLEQQLAEAEAEIGQAKLMLWTHDGIVIPDELSLTESAAAASRSRDYLTLQMKEAELAQESFTISASALQKKLVEAEAEIVRLKEENEDLQTKCTETFDDQVLNTVSRTQWEALTTALSALETKYISQSSGAARGIVLDIRALLDSLKEGNPSA